MMGVLESRPRIPMAVDQSVRRPDCSADSILWRGNYLTPNQVGIGEL